VLTVPALLFCCAYASGVLGTVAPKGWKPIEAAPVSETGLGAQPGHRMFGVALTGNGLRAWNAGTDVHPSLLMSFQQWYNRQLPTKYLAQDVTVGIKAQLITWEPWRPKPAKLGASVQDEPEPGFTDREIAGGRWDNYITSWARAVRKYHGITVYIRFAHEMNGNWYPWSHRPRQYVLAWRHVVRIFRKLNVTNAQFVWSASVGAGIPRAKWQRHMLAYWPGRKYVDDIGITMINFGGTTGHTHPVNAFTPRLAVMHQIVPSEPMMLTEVDTQNKGRIPWMRHLARYVARTPWLTAVVWSQLFSRGAAGMQGTGNMGWQIKSDGPVAKRVFQQLAHAAVEMPASTAGLTVTAGRGP
jgi:hypothetical protein